MKVSLPSSLLAIQAVIVFVTGVEAALMALAIGNSAGASPAVASFGLASLLLAARSRHRLLYWLEGGVLVWSTINLALSLFLVGTTSPLTAIVSGFILPTAILVLARST
jgi:hypothetical protein